MGSPILGHALSSRRIHRGATGLRGDRRTTDSRLDSSSRNHRIRDGSPGTSFHEYLHACIRILNEARAHRRRCDAKLVHRRGSGRVREGGRLERRRGGPRFSHEYQRRGRRLSRSSSQSPGERSRRVDSQAGLGVINRGMPAPLVVVRPKEFIELNHTALGEARPVPYIKSGLLTNVKSFCSERIEEVCGLEKATIQGFGISRRRLRDLVILNHREHQCTCRS